VEPSNVWVCRETESIQREREIHDGHPHHEAVGACARSGLYEWRDTDFFLDGRVQGVAVHWITISRIVLSWSCPQTPKPDEQDRSNHGFSL
jgi:hypothetical protein